jgi:hypothetical protein
MNPKPSFVCPECYKAPKDCPHIARGRRMRLRMEGTRGVVLCVDTRKGRSRVYIEVSPYALHDDVRALIAPALNWCHALHKRDLADWENYPSVLGGFTMFMLTTSARQHLGHTCQEQAEDLTNLLNARVQGQTSNPLQLSPGPIQAILEDHCGFGSAEARSIAEEAVRRVRAGQKAFSQGKPFDGDALRSRLQAWRRSPEGRQIGVLLPRAKPTKHPRSAPKLTK